MSAKANRVASKIAGVLAADHYFRDRGRAGHGHVTSKTFPRQPAATSRMMIIIPLDA